MRQPCSESNATDTGHCYVGVGRAHNPHGFTAHGKRFPTFPPPGACTGTKPHTAEEGHHPSQQPSEEILTTDNEESSLIILR